MKENRKTLLFSFAYHFFLPFFAGASTKMRYVPKRIRANRFIVPLEARRQTRRRFSSHWSHTENIRLAIPRISHSIIEQKREINLTKRFFFLSPFSSLSLRYKIERFLSQFRRRDVENILHGNIFLSLLFEILKIGACHVGQTHERKKKFSSSSSSTFVCHFSCEKLLGIRWRGCMIRARQPATPLGGDRTTDEQFLSHSPEAHLKVGSETTPPFINYVHLEVPPPSPQHI